MEELEVTYRITAVWETSDGSGKQATYVDYSIRDGISPGPSRLDAPVLFHPDTDLGSVDGSAIEPESWLELPLVPERPIPFSCRVSVYVA